jgi:dihydrolipoamide dehydrogenase
LVVGGGYIGLEMATVYAALGSEVTVVEMTDGILPGADRDLAAILKKEARRHMDIRVSTKVAEVKEQKRGLKVTLEGKETETATFDTIIVATGRRPVTDGLGLEHTSVQVNDKGFVTVDGQRRTSDPHIYAIGDIAGEPMLAHKGAHEGMVAAEAIAGEKVAFEPAVIPAVVYTDPELAWCGLTEREAKADGLDVTVAKFPWGASGRATTLGRNEGVTKLISDTSTGRVLGMGICGAGAGELIAEGVLAIEMAALADDVKLSIHPHPSLSETVMEAAEMISGPSTHVYRKR